MAKAPAPAKRGMVWVNLRSNWFSPDGSLYEVTKNPHQFPAEWAEPADEGKRSKFAVLPSNSEVLSKEDAKAADEADKAPEAE